MIIIIKLKIKQNDNNKRSYYRLKALKKIPEVRLDHGGLTARLSISTIGADSPLNIIYQQKF